MRRGGFSHVHVNIGAENTNRSQRSWERGDSALLGNTYIFHLTCICHERRGPVRTAPYSEVYCGWEGSPRCGSLGHHGCQVITDYLADRPVQPNAPVGAHCWKKHLKRPTRNIQPDWDVSPSKIRKVFQIFPKGYGTIIKHKVICLLRHVNAVELYVIGPRFNFFEFVSGY